MFLFRRSSNPSNFFDPLIGSPLLTDFDISLNVLSDESLFATILQLVKVNTTVLENFYCNTVAAKIFLNTIKEIVVILGHPSHGCIVRATKKQILLRASHLSDLENILYNASKCFLKFTKSDSVKFLLYGDDLKCKLNDFDEQLKLAIQELAKLCEVKDKRMVTSPAIEYGNFVLSDIADSVIAASEDMDSLVKFAEKKNIKMYKYSNTMRVETNNTLPKLVGYNRIICHIIQGDHKDVYTEEFVELVNEIFETTEYIRQIKHDAAASVTLGSHTVISQYAMRIFWQKITKGSYHSIKITHFFECIKDYFVQFYHVKDYGKLTESNLQQGDDGLLLSDFEYELTKGFLKPFIDLDESKGIDATEVAKLCRFIPHHIDDLREVLKLILKSAQSSSFLLAPPCPQVLPQAGISSYSVEQHVFKNLSEIDAKFNATINSKSSNCARVTEGENVFNTPNPKIVVIDHLINQEIHSLLFSSIGGLIIVEGPRGCGKTSQILYAVHSHPSSVSSPKVVTWIDFDGVKTRSQASARMIRQLGLKHCGVGEPRDTLIAFKRYLNRLRNGSIVILDNIDFYSTHLVQLKAYKQMKQQNAQQPHYTAISKHRHGLIQFFTDIAAVTYEFYQVHTFVYVTNSVVPNINAASNASVNHFNLKDAVKQATSSFVDASENYVPSSTDPTDANILANMNFFNKKYSIPFPSKQTLHVLARNMIPVDHENLRLASCHLPGEMQKILSFCSLNTIRKFSKFISNDYDKAMREIAVQEELNCGRGLGSTGSRLKKLRNDGENDLNQSYDGIALLKIATKYRENMISSSVSDKIFFLSNDEKLLASCISYFIDSFSVLTSGISPLPQLRAPQSPASNSIKALSLTTFSPFEETMIWELTKSAFNNDLVRWNIAWEGLIRENWLEYKPDIGGYFISDPPIYLPTKNVTAVFYTHPYAWSSELCLNAQIQALQHLWDSYVFYWCGRLVDLYEIGNYYTRAYEQELQSYHHFENLLRIFTKDYMHILRDVMVNAINMYGDTMSEVSSVSKTGGSKKLKKSKKTKKTSKSSNYDAESVVSESKHSGKEYAIVELGLTSADEIARRLAGKLGRFLTFCNTAKDGVETSSYVLEALSLDFHELALVANLDQIGQMIRLGQTEISKTKLIELFYQYGVENLLQPIDRVDEHKRELDSENPRAATSIVPNISLAVQARMCSLRGRLHQLNNQKYQAEKSYDTALKLWQVSIGQEKEKVRLGEWNALSGWYADEQAQKQDMLGFPTPAPIGNVDKIVELHDKVVKTRQKSMLDIDEECAHGVDGGQSHYERLREIEVNSASKFHHDVLNLEPIDMIAARRQLELLKLERAVGNCVKCTIQ